MDGRIQWIAFDVKLFFSLLHDSISSAITVSNLIRGELKGLAKLKYLTHQFWMVEEDEL